MGNKNYFMGNNITFLVLKFMTGGAVSGIT